MKNSSPEQQALEIIKRLERNGYKAFIAGGYVRNMLLGIRDNDDIDIATEAPPEKITEIFKNHKKVGQKFGVILVIMHGIPFEVSTFRSDIGIKDGRHPEKIIPADPETDAQRRDFTINGLFYDPQKKEIHDYINGRSDLEKGIIRTIGKPEERFREDLLRTLRAVRFSSRFSFPIDGDTWNALCEYSSNINIISKERIFQEMNKMLTGPAPEQSVRLMNSSGLMQNVIPEVSSLEGVPQPPEFHPEGDVMEHTLKALSLMNAPSPVLAWSVLLHDVGKPATMRKMDRIRFNNHHFVGARMAKKILSRLKCSRSLTDRVTACIENHMNFMNVRKMRLGKLKKFLSRPTIIDELELHRIDCLSSHGNLDNYFFLLEALEKFEDESLKPQPFLRGKDLINLGLKPGPEFGRILKDIYDLQLDEKITSKEEAIEWVRENAAF